MYPMTEETRESSFDALTKGMASGTVSRGRALRLMGAALVGGTLASVPSIASAAAPPRPNGRKCKQSSQCASGNCQGGVCQAAGGGGVCPTGTTNCDGARPDCVSTTCASGQYFASRTCSCRTITGRTVNCVYHSDTNAQPTITSGSCFQDSACPSQQYMDSSCGQNAQYIGDGSYTFESASCSETDYCG